MEEKIDSKCFGENSFNEESPHLSNGETHQFSNVESYHLSNGESYHLSNGETHHPCPSSQEEGSFSYSCYSGQAKDTEAYTVTTVQEEQTERFTESTAQKEQTERFTESTAQEEQTERFMGNYAQEELTHTPLLLGGGAGVVGSTLSQSSPSGVVGSILSQSSPSGVVGPTHSQSSPHSPASPDAQGIHKLSIANWSSDDQPREKLRDKGTQALSNAELLAILIGSGTPGVSAVELMQQILTDCNNNLNTLGKMTIRQLTAYKGVGEAKAITILAACELGKRRQLEKAEERPALTTATHIYNHMHPLMQDLDVEEFWVLLLNQGHRLIKKMRIAHGGISEVSVDVRIIIREAVLSNATIVVACHNHPSGNLTPSQADDRLTQQLKRACELMRLHFMDHVILVDGSYFSYHESGKL